MSQLMKTTGAISARELESAKSRFAAIAGLVQLSNKPYSQRFPHVMSDGRCVQNWTEAVAWCASQTGRSVRNIWAIWGAFQRGGSQALNNKPRRDSGGVRFFQHYPAAAVFAFTLYFTETQNVTKILVEMERNFAALGIERDQLPSYESLRRWLRSATIGPLVSSLLQEQKNKRGADSERDVRVPRARKAK
jgi:hypothetical protein